jgi:hypothetical protein
MEFQITIQKIQGYKKFEIKLSFRVAAQCKTICPEWLNWPVRLLGNSEGASGISK